MPNIVKSLAMATAAMALAGCEQAFRYPCQNPANWDSPQCKPPICEVNRDCPDLILKDAKPAVPAPAQRPIPQGECK